MPEHFNATDPADESGSNASSDAVDTPKADPPSPSELPTDPADIQQWLSDQPWREITRDGVDYCILGTAHVSRRSAEVVAGLIDSRQFDAVAIELCPSRHKLLTDSQQWQSTDLFALIRQGKAGLMLANLVLSGYQKRLAKQFGIEPGAEMRAAMQAAQQHNLPLQLIDRDLGTTMKRVWRSLGFWNRLMLFTGLITSVFSRETVSEDDIEKLKEGDMLESAFAEFAAQSPALFNALIAERDGYMAARLRAENPVVERLQPHRVLVVIGAGHLQGLARQLREEQADPDGISAELTHIPPASRWPKIIPWLIVALITAGFAFGFMRNADLGWNLVKTWVVINGGLAALGAIIARAHPLTVLSALVGAPLTSLNPTIGAGMVTASVEAWVRKPNVADFETLRDDVIELSGWWRNRVARTLLVFFLCTLGSAIGTWVAGFSIIQQLS